MKMALRLAALAVLSAILVLLPNGGDADQLAGKFKRDEYTAPDKNFKAKFLLEKFEPGVADSWDRASGIGTVSFYNMNGALNGVIYTRIPGNKAETLTSEALADWLRAVPLAMTEDAGLTPDVLREEAREFDGRAAWIAVVSIPGGGVVGSAQWDMSKMAPSGETKYNDSTRGFVVFARGNYVYALHCEIEVPGFFLGSGSHYDPDDWDAFMDELGRFYEAMRFADK